MLEDVGPDLGKALVTGLLAGGASVAVQLLSPRVAKLLRRLRLNRAGESGNQQRVERRLAAILAADVAGYSRLMTADEEGTHFRLLSHRREVIEPKVREHRGRIVKHTGDGALAEFGSVVDAVRCALEVQKLMVARNAGVSQSRRIEFRMGFNLGDVIVGRTTFTATASTSPRVWRASPRPAESASPPTLGGMCGERLPPSSSTWESSG